ncbi:MAG TPA: hypothetical protein VFV87_06615 [Pirellulaceae bacterium]|nr:hypothetical protein [Pirellulaceae bacterium]
MFLTRLRWTAVIDPYDPLDAIEVVSTDGRAICYLAQSAGNCHFLLFVDESPDEECLLRRDNVAENILLRVPSGRLVATGFEELCGDEEDRYAPDRFEPTKGETVRIPVGNYRVTACELNWNDLVKREISRRAVPGDERFETIVGSSMGCVTVSTIFLAPTGLLIVWLEFGSQTALRAVGYVLLFQLVFWALAIALICFSKAWGRLNRLRDEIKSEFPDALLVLRTLGHDEGGASFNTGIFGSAWD